MTRELTIEVKTKIRWDQAKVTIPIDVTVDRKTNVILVERPLASAATMIAERVAQGLNPLPEGHE